VAFLTALLRQKLDDEFPEIIHELVRLIWPHYLRPLPSASVVAFTPKPILKQALTIPAGTQLASKPVEGTACVFQTCYPVEVHPLKLLEASLVETSGQPPAIRMLLELSGLNLEDWQPQALRFYLAGDFQAASDLYLLLRRYLTRILISAEGNNSTVAPTPDSLKPVGFGAGRRHYSVARPLVSGLPVDSGIFYAAGKISFSGSRGMGSMAEQGQEPPV